MRGERLKAVRKKLGLSQIEFGEALKINASAISQMENDHIKPSLDTLLLLSRRYNVDLHWLITGKGAMFTIDGEKPSQDTSRNIIKIKQLLNEELMGMVRLKESALEGESFDLAVMGEISAGPPVEAHSSVLDVVSVRRSMIHGVVDDYVCLRVNGHSMEPDIHHDDVVIIRKSQDWDKLQGLICAVRLDGAITLKKLTLDPRRKLIVLVAINEEYPPIVIDPRDHLDVNLIGTLYYLYRKLQ